MSTIIAINTAWALLNIYNSWENRQLAKKNAVNAEKNLANARLNSRISDDLSSGLERLTDSVERHLQ